MIANTSEQDAIDIVTVINEYEQIIPGDSKNKEGVANQNIPKLRIEGKNIAGRMPFSASIIEILPVDSTLVDKCARMNGSYSSDMIRMFKMTIFAVDKLEHDKTHYKEMRIKFIDFRDGNMIQECTLLGLKDTTRSGRYYKQKRKELILTVTNWKLLDDDNISPFVKFHYLFMPVIDHLKRESYDNLFINVDIAVGIFTRSASKTKIAEQFSEFVYVALKSDYYPIHLFVKAFVIAIGKFLKKFAEGVRSKDTLLSQFSWILRCLSIKLVDVDSEFATMCGNMHRDYCRYIGRKGSPILNIEDIPVNIYDNELSNIIKLPSKIIKSQSNIIKSQSNKRHIVNNQVDENCRQPASNEKKTLTVNGLDLFLSLNRIQ